MKKPAPIHGFFMIYLSLIVFSYLIHQFMFQDLFVSSTKQFLFSIGIAQVSLTAVDGHVFTSAVPPEYFIIDLFITQISGMVFLTILLWLYLKLFKSSTEEINLLFAFRLTLKVSFLSEIILILFFLYSIPVEITEHSFLKKILAACYLAINSFNNAGIAGIEQLIQPGILQQNFVLQIGIITGSTLGSLGIFVIYELLSPTNLKERLINPLLDWSLITKISIYGGVTVLVVFSGVYYLSNLTTLLADKNILESLTASLYEISGVRGLGHTLFEKTEYYAPSIIRLLASIFVAGPFTTGGGLTLLGIFWIYSLIFQKTNRSVEINTSIRLAKSLIIYSLIAFGVTTVLVLLAESPGQVGAQAKQQWLLFTTNSYTISSDSHWAVGALKGITNIAGRISFIVAGSLVLYRRKN